MNENRHPIDDLFRDGLSQHSVEAPMHVWERIDQTRTPVYKLLNNFKQNSRWYLSVAAGLVLMSSAAIMFLVNEPQQGLAEGTLSNAPQIHTEKTPSAPGTAAFKTTNPEAEIANPANTSGPSGTDISGTESAGTETAGSGTTPSGRTNPTDPGSSTPSQYAGGLSTQFENPGTEEMGGEVAVPEYEKTAVGEGEIPETTDAGTEPTDPNTDPVSTPPTPTPGPAPDKKQVPTEPSDWALEVLGSYDFMSRRIENADPAYVSARKNAEKMGAAYTFQLRAQYRLNDAFALRSGVSFSQHHEKLNFTHTQSNTEIVERQETGYILDPINGPTPITYTVRDTVTTTTTTSAKSDNTYTFIDIPVLLNYTFYTSNKLNLGVSGGPVFNLAFKQKGQIIGPVNNEIIDLNSSANPFRTYAGVNLMLNLSASYELNKRFDLLFEPGLRYGMSSLTSKGFGVTQKYSSVNLFTGIRYRF